MPIINQTTSLASRMHTLGLSLRKSGKVKYHCQEKQEPSHEEVAKFVTKNKILWNTFLEELANAKVVTNAAVVEYFNIFVHERKEDIHMLMKNDSNNRKVDEEKTGNSLERKIKCLSEGAVHLLRRNSMFHKRKTPISSNISSGEQNSSINAGEQPSNMNMFGSNDREANQEKTKHGIGMRIKSLSEDALHLLGQKNMPQEVHNSSSFTNTEQKTNVNSCGEEPNINKFNFLWMSIPYDKRKRFFNTETPQRFAEIPRKILIDDQSDMNHGFINYDNDKSIDTSSSAYEYIHDQSHLVLPEINQVISGYEFKEEWNIQTSLTESSQRRSDQLKTEPKKNSMYVSNQSNNLSQMIDSRAKSELFVLSKEKINPKVDLIETWNSYRRRDDSIGEMLSTSL